MTTNPFPRPDYLPEDARAWLHDAEREMYAALTHPDITIEITAKVELREKREARRTGRQAERVSRPDRDRREREASRHVMAAGRAAANTAAMLAEIAQLRANLIALLREQGGADA